LSSRNVSARRSVPGLPLWHNEWLSVHRLADAIMDAAARVEGSRFLDVGCGNKPYRGWFARGAFYVGTDITHVNNSADVVAQAPDLPFAAAVFDGVLCTQVLEHVERPAAVVGELARVLRPGGRLLLSAPMYWRQHEEPYDFYRYTRYGLRYLLESNSFEVESMVQQGGAWCVVGQAFTNTFHSSIGFRTFGLKAMVLLISNTFFDCMDRVCYRPDDTCNFLVVAKKI
jgi:SAM-dependent methyltransferase